jgi:hypothetical protein
MPRSRDGNNRHAHGHLVSRSRWSYKGNHSEEYPDYDEQEMVTSSVAFFESGISPGRSWKDYIPLASLRAEA